MRHEGMRREGARTDNEGVARTTASDLKTVAEDMLRMGRHWARAAQGWLERAGDDAQRGEAQRRSWSRSDRDLQSDYGGDGYDQVDTGWRQSRDYGAQSQGGYTGAHGAGSGAYEYTGRDYGGRDYRGVGPRNYTRSDERIREDLNERLTEAYDLDASGITVEVANGVATLNGRVPQRWMKHRAEDLADACIGVSDVRNHILVGDASASASATDTAGTTSTSGTTAGTTSTSQAGSVGKESP
jgi:osmotically-inducible protein OsmY